MAEPAPSLDVRLRPGLAADLPGLTAIYNHYVIETPITFDTRPFTAEERQEWFERYGLTGRYRLLVAEHNGYVVGYTTTSRYHPRAAYDTTVESTILCAPEAVGFGIGAKLYESLFESLAGEDVHSVVALVTLPNRGSTALHERFDFREVGVIREAGRKFGRYWDVATYQKMLVGSSSRPDHQPS